MRVAIYARVSTDDQNAEMQVRELRRFASNRNFEVVAEYVDEGVSGSKRNRPQLDQLMDGARKRRFDAVLVWKFDRWARSTKHLVETLSEFRERGIQFLSFTENVDTSTPMGEAMFSIIAAMAQLERDLIRERTRAALRISRENGVVLGGRAHKKYNEKFAGKDAVVRELREAGHSFRDIARQLGVSKNFAFKASKRA